MRTVRLFVSSPGDVDPERQRVQWIADRLSGEFAHKLRFETILWETSVYNAHEGGFQPQIEKPADCDIVLTIFWSRLGTELHDSFPERMPDGKPYPSGTAYEVLSALEARKANQHRPDVFVFRKIAIPTAPLSDKVKREEAVHQWERLEDFFARYFVLPDKRILRVVETFREIGEFERKVELLLRDWIKSNVSQGTIWPIEEKGSPFRGLEPFDAKHAEVYCGRDRKVLRAIDELLIAARRGKPFLLIPGASGSGKSSLMRAGLAPRLVRPGAVGGVDLWRIAVTRPATEGNPLLALARALFVTGDERHDDPGGFGMALPELAQGAFKTPELVAQLLKGAAEVAVAPIVAALDQVGKAETSRRGFERPLQANLLLLVDQLEDIFAGSVAPEERIQFANLLGALVNTQRVWLIATLRGDLYEHMITERPFVALKDICGQFDLGPPGPDELDEIVHRSAEAAGLQYEERIVKDAAGGERRERLDDRLLVDAAGENTLPLLQFAFDLLFEKCWVGRQSKVLTLAAYEEIGGLDGAINQTAEIALARLVRPGADIRFPLEKDIQDEIVKTINPRLETLFRKLVVPVGQERQKAEVSAGRALTARIVPMGEARRDEPTGQLIEALLHARILLATRSAQGSCLRIAHDRVITSWDRARALIEKNREFYRIKDSIEQERQRWEESKRSAEFLIPAGAQISQAEETIRRFGDEFSDDARTFVAASGRRARFRQRLMTAATLLFAAVAVIASGSSYYATLQRNYAMLQQRKATENYKAARDTVGNLVTSIAHKLRDLDGITVPTIEAALNQVVALVDDLEKQNPGDPELRRIHGQMHYEFAKVFQNTRNLDRALKEAESGLTIRNQLVAQKEEPQWLSDQAESLDQVGDIHRAMAINLDQDKDRRAAEEFVAAREQFDHAYAIRARLHSQDKDKREWVIGLSQSLVRIGDLKVKPEENFDGAKANYQSALQLIIEAFRREPDKEDLQRELSWDYMKVGDILVDTTNILVRHPSPSSKKDLDGGLLMYENGLCIRRYLASEDPLKALYKRDVAFSLEKIGTAKQKEKDFVDSAKEPLFEALELRRELSDGDPDHRLWLNEYAETLLLIGRYMHDTKHYDLAGGFFARVVEKLTPVVRDERVEKTKLDLRVKKNRDDADKIYNKVIGLLGTETRSQASSLAQLEMELKRLAGDEEELERARQRQRSPIDPALTWKDLKESLSKPAPVQTARSN